MRRLVCVHMLGLGLSLGVPAVADKAEWDRLNEESQALY